jgi:gliding motility-associated-like protein
LFRNDGQGSFTQITEGISGQEEIYSNGASWGDYNNDGYLDLFVANESAYRQPAPNFLYRNNGNGSFTKITTGAIVTDTSNALGSAWGDYDNDGYLDLFVANYEKDFEDYHTVQGYRNLLYHNNGDGTFTRITDDVIVADSSTSSGAAWGDCDNDGDLDLFVANYYSPSLLFINSGNGNNWLNIKLIGNASNKSAIGAVVRLKANGIWQMRHVEALSGALSQNSLNVEFGLGKATVIDSICVQWPSGSKSMMSGVAVNQFLTIEEEAVKNESLAILVADSSDCSSHQVVLQVDGVYDNYLWQDGSTGSSLVVRESGVYTVVATSNCRTLTATKEVKLVERKPLFIPNVITPNGDNYNDFFMINDWLLGARVEIYNRWGKQVYKSENYQNEWQAEYLPNGIYFYQLKHSCLAKGVKGWISVLR